MDVSLTHTSNTTTTTTTTTTGSTKSPEPDTETPTRAPLPSKPSHFSNGILKRHNGLGHFPVVASAYKECLRNHAASLGGHALDGCLEFMPSPTSTASDPTSLKCAACGCHRNFHRREPDHPTGTPPPIRLPAIEYQPHHRHHPPPPPPPQPLHPPALPRSPSSASPPPISSHPPSSAPHMLLALSAAPESSIPPPPPPPSLQGLASSLDGGSGPARKRFRTKFSQSQKERMFEFAERVGWRMQKREDDAIREFCNNVGVDRGVFKVWMHNNKNTFGKPRVVLDHFDDYPDSSAHNPGTSSANPVANNKDDDDAPPNPAGGSTTQDLFQIHHHHHIQQHHDRPPTGTNGGSSSSS